MGYYQYLCDLLAPLGVYALGEDSISGAELYAAGSGLDGVAEKLAYAEREGLLFTAQDEGIARREKLFARCPVNTTPAQRRSAVAALGAINTDAFTLEAINAAVAGCGIPARVEESERYGVVKVSFPGTVGQPEEFSQIARIIQDIIPCHLEISYIFRYLTWADCAAQEMTWQWVQAQGHSWRSFQEAVRL